MTDCQPESSYLATPDFLANSLYYLTIIETPVVGYGGYCILFKTPKEMSSVKLLMACLHGITAVSDLVISCFSVPYIVLPAMAGHGLGVFDAPGLMHYLLITSLSGVAAMIVAIYENRYFTLFGWKTWWRHARKPVLLTMYIMVPLCFLPPYFDVPDQEFAREQVSLALPCLPAFTYNNRPMYVLALSYALPCIGLAIGVACVGVLIAVFFWLIVWNIFKKRAISISLRTQRIQKSFAIAFSVQSAFLLIALLVPVIIALTVIFIWYHNQALNNLIFIILSLHGIGSTIVMILVHRPYREFTISRFCCFRKVPRISGIISTAM